LHAGKLDHRIGASDYLAISMYSCAQIISSDVAAGSGHYVLSRPTALVDSTDEPRPLQVEHPRSRGSTGRMSWMLLIILKLFWQAWLQLGMNY